MKNKIIYIIFLIMVLVTSCGQQVTEKAVAGLTVANIKTKGTNSVDDKPLIGFHAGIQANLPINERISLEGGVSVMFTGGKTVYNVPNDYYPPNENEKNYIEFTKKSRLNSLSAPMFVNYRVGNKGIKLHGGARISYLLGGEVNTKYNPPLSPSSKPLIAKSKDEFKNMDLSTDLGVSYAISNKAEIDLTYSHGLVNISKSTLIKSYSRNLNVTLKYNLNFYKEPKE